LKCVKYGFENGYFEVIGNGHINFKQRYVKRTYKKEISSVIEKIKIQFWRIYNRDFWTT
jgi:hypothetical protein